MWREPPIFRGDVLESSENKQEEFETLRFAGERVMIEFGIVELLMKIKEQKYNTLIFLDKSARPLGWITKDAMTRVYPGDPVPEIKFINPPPGLMTTTAERDVSEDSAAKGQENEEKAKKLFQEKFGRHLHGKVCLVDECKSTGQSYQVIRRLIGSLPEYEGAEVDEFDVMQIWPSWRPQSSEKTGVKDSADTSHFLSEGNANDEARKFREEMKRLSEKIVQDFPVISQTLSEHAQRFGKNGMDASRAIVGYLEQSGFTPEGKQHKRFGGGEIFIDANQLSEKLRGNALSAHDILTLYSLVRKFKVKIWDDQDTIHNKISAIGHLDPSRSAALEKLSMAVEAALREQEQQTQTAVA